jgi:hypothetical protein
MTGVTFITRRTSQWQSQPCYLYRISEIRFASRALLLLALRARGNQWRERFKARDSKARKRFDMWMMMAFYRGEIESWREMQQLLRIASHRMASHCIAHHTGNSVLGSHNPVLRKSLKLDSGDIPPSTRTFEIKSLYPKALYVQKHGICCSWETS